MRFRAPKKLIEVIFIGLQKKFRIISLTKKLLCFWFLLGSTALAQSQDRGIPLNFPARQNNIQVLPQKFEYSLRDAFRFLLGNRIIDTSNFEFQMIPQSESVQIRFRWPQSLFEKGTLSILNPSGVAVWSSPLQDNENSMLIEDGTNLATRLLGLSFFKFCITQYELNTGMEVCSPEFIAKGTGKNLRVEVTPYTRKPQISINGRSVTPHGIVFLNDEKESLSFRATAASGAEFKMDTRSISLDFVDIINLNENLMKITIKGPFPLAPSQYQIIQDNLWSVTLKKERPLIYISGEGQVPLRQEFVVQGPLPREENRLHLDKNSPTRAYASSLELRGWSPNRGTPQAADSSADVAVAGNRFTWALKDLNVGQDKMSTVQVVDGKDVFTAGYTFSRQHANRFEAQVGLNTDKSRLYIGGEGQMWFESLPFLTQQTQQRLGLGLLYNQDITGDPRSILAEISTHWRIKKGLQLLESSPIVGLGLQNWTFDGESIQTLAPFVGWVGPSFKKLKYFEWQEFQLKYSLRGKSDDLELKSRTELRWKLYRPWKKYQMLKLGVGFYSMDAGQKSSGGLLEAGWMLSF